MFVATVICALLPIAGLVATAIFKDHDVITSSGIFYVILFLFGSLLAYIGLLIWIIWKDTFTCNLFIWFSLIGGDIVIGSNFFKLFNAYMSSKGDPLKAEVKTPLKYNLYLAVIGGMIFIDVCVLVIWMIVFPISAVTVVPDLYRPVLNYNVCYTEYADVLFIVLYTIKILEILLTFITVVMTKALKGAFYEYKYIRLSIYNTLATFLTSAIVYFVIDTTQRIAYFTSYTLFSVLFLWALTISTLVIFGTKIYYIGEAKELNEEQK